MISFGNAASSHSGLIPLKTAYKKRGELLWAIASKKNFINLHSAAFVTVFARNLVHAYKFRIFQNRSINVFINLKIPRSIVNKYTLQVSRTLKTGKAFKQHFKYNQFFEVKKEFLLHYPCQSPVSAISFFNSPSVTCESFAVWGSWPWLMLYYLRSSVKNQITNLGE